MMNKSYSRIGLALLPLALAAGVLLWLGFYSVENKGQTTSTRQVDCLPVEIAFFVGDRIHVKCFDPQKAVPLSPIEYFSISTQDSATQTILNILQNNFETPGSQGITIVYDNNPASNPAGCLRHDCRKITGITLQRSSRR